MRRLGLRAMFLIADFEASSLTRHSYPVEVGWVDEHGRGEAYLIRPADGWDDWSRAPQTIHGIAGSGFSSKARIPPPSRIASATCSRPPMPSTSMEAGSTRDG